MAAVAHRVDASKSALGVPLFTGALPVVTRAAITFDAAAVISLARGWRLAIVALARRFASAAEAHHACVTYNITSAAVRLVTPKIDTHTVTRNVPATAALYTNTVFTDLVPRAGESAAPAVFRIAGEIDTNAPSLPWTEDIGAARVRRLATARNK